MKEVQNKGDTGYSRSLLPGFPIQQDINISLCVSLFVVSPSDSESRSGGLSCVCVSGGLMKVLPLLPWVTVQSFNRVGWGRRGCPPPMEGGATKNGPS